ncbi:transcription initiation factor TFIID subunit 8-like [Zingiber officinale]|uniref:Bromodomain associated domain-containing protein n=1 Tax=Zingiber officinale TaxID=94328 RepID=A0A8J5H649_ZINOF|nr:transcription initiation factor TFIID subunit 8-like [Zingiber officinale]KAG6521124.1 hypothetical protein ZIOFF_018190 [Zingiber officinale]
MTTPRRRKFKAEPQQQPATLPSPSPAFFHAATTRVAVAQICLATGYSAAEPSSLRALSDIAALYLQALGRAAASVAAAHHRTDSNLLDLVRAIEDLSAAKGFPGGSDPTGQPLRSCALRELKEFVELVEEIPFAKPIPRGGEEEQRTTWRSFAAAGKEPPPHVPSWLPCFPEEPRNKEMKEQRTTWGSFAAAARESPQHVPSWLPCLPEDREMEPSTEKKRKTAVELPAEREKVVFRLGFGKRKPALGHRGKWKET